MNGSDVYVFLGPSLPLAAAREILPDAHYLPPVQCRDVLRVLRLRPRILVIIDGLFERVAAVWHKEILLALHRGVTVVGGGSMGALRAAELAPLGMLGVGRSFQEFADGTLVDDDEVAVIHTRDGEPLCDAMVNIRDTVEAAVAAGLVTAAQGQALVEHAKASHYPERSLELSARATLPAPRAAALVQWCRAGGLVDRKRDDARRVLQHVAALVRQGPREDRPRPPSTPLPMTGFLRTLARQTSCSAFGRMRDELPRHEQVACAARFLGHAYQDARRAALLLASVHDVAVARAVSPAARVDDFAGLDLRGSTAPPELEGTAAQWQALRERVSRVVGLERALGLGPADVERSLLDLMRVEGVYPRFRAHPAGPAAALAAARPQHHRRYHLIARLWAIFDRVCEHEGMVPRTADLQDFADRFRFVRDLSTAAPMHAWLEAHGLDEAQFVGLMIRWYRFETLVPNANLGVFGVAPADDPVWWLRDALWLTGLYDHARALLDDPRPGRWALPQDDEQAYARDFIDGLASVPAELAALGPALQEAV